MTTLEIVKSNQSKMTAEEIMKWNDIHDNPDQTIQTKFADKIKEKYSNDQYYARFNSPQ